jgi:RNA polymerase sigma-70 factor (ECF subfamily)
MLDDDLLRRAKLKEKEAVEQLLRALEPIVYKTALSYMANAADALDVTQEALYRIYLKLDLFEHNMFFYSWVYKITRNICMDVFRSRKVEIDFDSVDEHSVASQNVEAIVEARDAHDALLRMLLDLPNQIRIIMTMRFVHNMGYEEIATELDIPLNTVRSSIHRGRSKLRTSLQHYEEGGIRI